MIVASFTLASCAKEVVYFIDMENSASQNLQILLVSKNTFITVNVTTAL